MHEFSNSFDNPLIYKDTDSLVLEKPLSNELIGPAIGQFKLEHEILEAIFLRPKTYALRTAKGEIVKAAGYPNKSLSFNDFIYIKDNPNTSKFIFSTKLIKSMSEMSIRQSNYKIELKFNRLIEKYIIKMRFNFEKFESVIVAIMAGVLLEPLY